jgi:hypothetical protein
MRGGTFFARGLRALAVPAAALLFRFLAAGVAFASPSAMAGSAGSA